MSPTDPLGGEPYVLDGRVVTMDAKRRVIDRGRVFVRDGRIVAVSEVGGVRPPGFEGAQTLMTGGTIYPGLIELHNHLSYNVLPLWQVPRPYGNRGRWASSKEKRRLISGPMQVLGRTGGVIEAIVRYVEAKALIGGTTTSQGITLINTAIQHHYRGLVRNVESTGDPELPAARTRIADVTDAPAFKRRLDDNASVLLHLAEGIDDTARGHFKRLRINDQSWAITDSLVGIHCAGLKGRDFATLRSRGGSMVWSPFSNMLLYGATADIAAAQSYETTLALGSDWSPSGSKNLLTELKVARLVSEMQGGLFTDRELVEMVTVNPASMIKWGNAVGSIEAGKKADFVAIDDRRGDPYAKLIDARESSVVLVVVDGAPRYGRPSIVRDVATSKETRLVNGAERALMFAQSESDPIVAALSLEAAETTLKDALTRLPDLALELADPGLHALNYGIQRGGEPGSWVLDLDNEGGSNRSLAPDDFVARLTGGAQESLQRVLSAIDLDPLTVVDDDRYFHRLVNQANLPDEIKHGLPEAFGTKAPKATPTFHSIGSLVESPTMGVATLDELDAIAGALTLADRELLVDQAILLLDQTYVHLSLKRAMHAVDPLQRLRLLRDRLDDEDANALSPELAFHEALLSIFTSLRDLHTNYLLPTPFREHTAFLPFLVEQYFDDDGKPRYVVSKLAPDFAHPTFTEGAEVLFWNGVPIDRAIAMNAALQAGSNPAAQHARGLDALTMRPLIASLPPDERWVIVTYLAEDGRQLDIRHEWAVFSPDQADGVDPDSTGTLSVTTALGNDLKTQAVSTARRALFAPAAVRAHTAVGGRIVAVGENIPTSMPSVFRGRTTDTPSGTFGVIRIFTFNVPSADAFVEEFARIADQLPDDGLIIDVRNNGGGLILAAEQLLQLLTPNRIEPSPSQFVTTPLIEAMVDQHSPSPLDATFDLSAWQPSLDLAVRTGATYSTAHAITPADAANAIGQRYHGPTVLITDALCYSATDMFAAGFQDHDIGPVLGIADNTGAGGANVWTHELFRLLVDGVPGPNPFEPLPGGAAMRASVRRTLRVGDRAGTPVEDLGVVPDTRHRMTKVDLLDSNNDLMAAAGALLGALPSYGLEVTIDPAGTGVDVTTVGLDRIDVYLDGRPVDTSDVGDGDLSLAIAVQPGTRVEVVGYESGVLRARRIGTA